MNQQMDQECIKLCKAMNLCRGIKTIESCCGHGRHDYRIFFIPYSTFILPDLLYWFTEAPGFPNWKVEVYTDALKSEATFLAIGSMRWGGRTYSVEELTKQSEEIAELIVKDQKTMDDQMNRMEKLWAYKGGKCAECGIQQHACIYEFHHSDPEKDLTYYDIQDLSLEQAKEKIDDCKMICANCHAEIHDTDE